MKIFSIVIRGFWGLRILVIAAFGNIIASASVVVVVVVPTYSLDMFYQNPLSNKYLKRSGNIW